MIMLSISGYNLYRRDRNKYGGVAFYVQNHISVKVRDDMCNEVEVLWLQVNLPKLVQIINI